MTTQQVPVDHVAEIIGQATRMLMERHQVSAVTARRWLTRIVAHRCVSVLNVAEQLTASKTFLEGRGADVERASPR